MERSDQAPTGRGDATRHLIPTALGDIAVFVSGGGPAMVYWPSLLMTSSMWHAQIEHFGPGTTSIRIDSPGHGESSALARTFTMEECALCLKQILDHLEVDRCVIVGNSWGGMLGGVFAALYPERVRAAVLMNSTASPASLRQKAEYRALVPILRALNSVPAPMVGRAVAAFVGKTSDASRPDVVAEIRRSISAVRGRSVSWAIESVVTRRTDQRALLRSVLAPVLVIAGDEDRTFPVAETKAMADAIPKSHFRVLHSVGHLAALEAPDLVNREIELFLAGV
jgi:3-oxoadipate enol-lactonase